MGDNALLCGLPNVCDGGTAITGSGGSASLAGKHNNQEPARVTSVSSMLPVDSTFQVWAPDAVSDIDLVAIIGHNMDRRRGSYWRAWVTEEYRASSYFDSTLQWLQQLYPTSRDDSTNLSGTYTDVDDDPWSTSADYIGISTGSTWMARFGFATPSVANSTVGNDHAFVIRAAIDPSFVQSEESITVKLYESDGAVATLLNAELVGDYDNLGRAIFIAPWSTSQLATSSGANVQVQIEGTEGARVYSVLWVAGRNLANVSSGGQDTGWIAVDTPPDSSSFGSISAGLVGEEPMAIEFKRLSTAETFANGTVPRIVVAFLNATTDASPTNQLGVLLAGKAYELDFNPATAELYFEDRSPVTETPGGQNLGSNLRRRRIFRVPFQYIDTADHIEIAERIDWRKGQTGAFYVNVFPNDATLKRLWGAWVRVAEAGAWIPHSEQGGFFFDRSYLLREKL